MLIVLLLRSFWFEPFRIPSGSMLPTLQVGDFILVNKYEYGVRLPVLDRKIWDVGKPQRGDVMVFKFPHDESVNFIKRVVGIPGDTVVYENKKLIVNGVEVTQESAGMYVIPSSRQAREVLLLNEKIGENQHLILVDENQQSVTMQFTVPNDHYFVLGDNRDYSNDSRFWGYVPEANIVGRAFLIWFSWDGHRRVFILVLCAMGQNWRINRISSSVCAEPMQQQQLRSDSIDVHNRSELTRILRYKFQNFSLLERALTHRSYGADNNDTLEFLGDSVLGFIVSDMLYGKIPLPRKESCR